ncbi:kinetochore protein Spc25-like [Acipenser oxyrinchus oxyrinchus]|uniref:Kinetochore protein SPC25 n=1 Tax=Acipenser oxyrinchus oxyrinchus TaxID=40147 RepID=A0AAD8DAI3_ACIOX|nr:kinetochore protein Spc25-like [Acipenser oxyrinchus oxyrinchus]
MACITHSSVPGQLEKTLKQVRSKLLNQCIEETYTTEITERKQAHKDAIKSYTDTCSKKYKEDELLFENFQTCRNDIEHQNVLVKEKMNEMSRILLDMQDKEKQKDDLITSIQQLREEQARKKDLMIAQNKANKDRLKTLQKSAETFEIRLRLEIRKPQGKPEQLQFVFRNINHKDLECPYTFILWLNAEGEYTVISCDPPLECMPQLEKKVRETNNFSAFLANVRKEFAALNL